MRIGPYIRVPASIARHPSLTPAAKLTFAAILAYQGKDTCCVASYQRIADRLYLSKATLKRCISQLHEARLVRPATETELGSRRPRGGYGEAPTKGWVCLLPAPKRPKRPGSK